MTTRPAPLPHTATRPTTGPAGARTAVGTVDVVVVAHRSADVIDTCLASLRADRRIGRVVVVDNASPDDSAERAQAWGAEVIEASNDGFGAGCNRGIAATTAPYVLLLNPDAAVRPGTVDGLCAHLDSHPHTAVVASELRHPDGRPEPVARRRPTVWRAPLEPGLAARLDARHLASRGGSGGPVPWLSGAALLVRRAAFDRVGGFDEAFFLYGEDADLCLRLRRAGWAVDHIPGLITEHVGGTSTAHLGAGAKSAWAQGWVRMARRHHRRPWLAVPAFRAGLRARALVWSCLGRRDRAAVWREAAVAAGRDPHAPVEVGARITVLGAPLDVVGLDHAVSAVGELIRRRRFAHVVTSNLDFLHQARHSDEIRDALWSADLVVPDGVPLLWMADRQRTPMRGRVNGTDLAVALLAEAGAQGWPVAFVGGESGVAAAAAEAASQRYGTPVAGVACPTRVALDDPDAGHELATWIASTGARILMLGVGGGRQERWIAHHRDALGPLLAIGVGSALDFVAGTRPRAPRWMQHAGLEWAWRLAHEPHRLWRRYLVHDRRVITAFARQHLDIAHVNRGGGAR